MNATPIEGFGVLTPPFGEGAHEPSVSGENRLDRSFLIVR